MKTMLFIWAFLIVICIGLTVNHALAQSLIYKAI